MSPSRRPRRPRPGFETEAAGETSAVERVPGRRPRVQDPRKVVAVEADDPDFRDSTEEDWLLAYRAAAENASSVGGRAPSVGDATGEASDEATGQSAGRETADDASAPGPRTSDAPASRPTHLGSSPVPGEASSGAGSSRAREEQTAAGAETAGAAGAPRRRSPRRPAPGRWRVLRRRRTRWLGAALGLVLVAAVILGVVMYTPAVGIRTITVEGTHRVAAADIQKELSSLEGESLARVTDQQVRDLIGNNVLISSVEIEAHPPHQLVVTVHERVAVAVVKEGSSYVLVDKDGVAVGTATSVAAAKVPLVDGGLAAVKSSSFSALVQMLQSLPQSLLAQMQKAQASDPADLRLTMDDGTTVVWGTADQSEYKAEVLQSLVKATDGALAGQTINVSAPDHPVTSS